MTELLCRQMRNITFTSAAHNPNRHVAFAIGLYPQEGPHCDSLSCAPTVCSALSRAGAMTQGEGPTIKEEGGP